MTETGLYNPRGGTCLVKSCGMTVPKSVRCGGNFKTRFISIFLNEELDRTDGEGAMFAVLEQRSGGSNGKTTRFIKLEHFFDAGTSSSIQRNNAAPRTFAEHGGEIQRFESQAIPRNQTDQKTRALTDPKTGVIEKHDEEIIPAAERRPEIDCGEKLADF